MRGVSLCVLAAIGINTIVVPAGPPETTMAAANQSYMHPAAVNPLFNPAIASVLPTSGQVVGVAHPVVVTFSAPVADRRAAERAIDIKSAPAMTGEFEWLESNVVQWVPDRYWPAHSTVALSVGGRLADFVTGPEVVGVANISDHSFTVSIDGVDAGPPSELPAAAPPTPLGKAGSVPGVDG